MNEVTVQSQMIQNGAAFTASPELNPIDAIYATNATDTPYTTNDSPLYTPISTAVPDNSPASPMPNIMAIVDDKKSHNALVYSALGLGALFLLSDDGKKTVQGITGIGGKKKKNKSLLPLLIIGGGAAWYFLKGKSDSTTTTTTNNNTTAPTDGTATPVQAAGLVYVPLTAPANDAQVHSQLWDYSVPWRYAVDRMTSQEMRDLWQYVYGYIKRNIRLYGYPGSYVDGNYDPVLYASIKALSNKWQLGLLN